MRAETEPIARRKPPMRNFFKMTSARYGISGAEERGYSSEERVIDVLLNLKEVTHVTQSNFKDKKDKRGKDLTVRLNPEYDPAGIYQVYIQVKSSGAGIRDFLEQYASRERINDMSLLNRHIISSRLIILSGQAHTEAIKRDFLRQLHKINSFFSPPEENVVP